MSRLSIVVAAPAARPSKPMSRLRGKAVRLRQKPKSLLVSGIAPLVNDAQHEPNCVSPRRWEWVRANLRHALALVVARGMSVARAFSCHVSERTSPHSQVRSDLVILREALESNILVGRFHDLL